jgi:AAA domain, putative AbiEii toxin, Type IV TA system
LKNIISVWISKLIFSGGGSFLLQPNEKIILVGPNNSGKSQSLREIMDLCEKGNENRTVVITDIEVSKKGSRKDLQEFLEGSSEYVGENYRYGDWQIHNSHIQFWDHPYLKYNLLNGFVKKIAADDRLEICKQQKSISVGDQKSKPQHLLYDDEALMGKITGLFKRAFGSDIMFDFRGGSKLPIHVGAIPKCDGVVDRVGDWYVNGVRKNPLLDKQGDGMKSYAGILFETIVANRDVTLIDEPEAFLHPPQMRRLGETLSSEVEGQLIVATHSSDILRGFLEGTKGKTRILRIRRENDVNLVSEASSEVIRELWEKPDLRYSNALEGVFHEQTIICEDDSDCRLINSVADHVSSGIFGEWKDTAYVPAGGKHGVPKIAGVLRKIGVPVKAVFDIDFLAERDLVRSTVDAFGGNWHEIEPIFMRVDNAVRGGIKARTVKEIKQDIAEMLADSDGLPKGDVIDVMKQGRPWAMVKKYGTRAIPNGHAQRDYNLLKEKLEEIGIFLVPVGEIENFCPDIGSHGPKFVTKLLSTVPLDDKRLADLREFVEQVHIGRHGSL